MTTTTATTRTVERLESSTRNRGLVRIGTDRYFDVWTGTEDAPGVFESPAARDYLTALEDRPGE